MVVEKDWRMKKKIERSQKRGKFGQIEEIESKSEKLHLSHI